MQIKKLHSWNLSYSQAMALQKQLAEKVQLIQLKNQLKTIAGMDCALSNDGQKIIAAVVVLRTKTAEQSLWGPAPAPAFRQEGAGGFEIIETTDAIQKINFPYIPGLLSFRESPACLAAVEKLKTQPDVFIIDGQGIAHPRRLGLASHLGLFFDKPTIGCAKSRLTGYFENPPPEKGAYTLLKDKTNDERRTTSDEIIGAVVRTRTNVKPVFVSVGNKCLLKDAIKITLDCATGYRLPEPTRLAHQTVSKLKLRG
jgi:deoxyribonuclease V